MFGLFAKKKVFVISYRYETEYEGGDVGVDEVHKTLDGAYRGMLRFFLYELSNQYNDREDMDEDSPGCYDPDKTVDDYSKKDIEVIVDWLCGSIHDRGMSFDIGSTERIVYIGERELLD